MKQNPVVLVIDDEAPIRRLLRLTLEPQGYRAFEANGGQLGLQEAAARRPDVIILDLGLPDMDGLTALKRLREWSQVPVLVLTVRNCEADKVAALDAGADDYLTKPFGAAELLARLRAVQRRAVAERRVERILDFRALRGAIRDDRMGQASVAVKQRDGGAMRRDGDRADFGLHRKARQRIAEPRQKRFGVIHFEAIDFLRRNIPSLFGEHAELAVVQTDLFVRLADIQYRNGKWFHASILSNATI